MCHHAVHSYYAVSPYPNTFSDNHSCAQEHIVLNDNRLGRGCAPIVKVRVPIHDERIRTTSHIIANRDANEASYGRPAKSAIVSDFDFASCRCGRGRRQHAPVIQSEAVGVIAGIESAIPANLYLGVVGQEKGCPSILTLPLIFTPIALAYNLLRNDETKNMQTWHLRFRCRETLFINLAIADVFLC